MPVTLLSAPSPDFDSSTVFSASAIASFFCPPSQSCLTRLLSATSSRWTCCAEASFIGSNRTVSAMTRTRRIGRRNARAKSSTEKEVRIGTSDGEVKNGYRGSAFRLPVRDGHDVWALAIGLGPGIHRIFGAARVLDDDGRGVRLLAVDEQAARDRIADMVEFQHLVAVEHDQQLGDVGGEIDAVHLRRAALGGGGSARDPADRAGGTAALAVEPDHRL